MKPLYLFIIFILSTTSAWSQQTLVINTDPRDMESGSGFFHAVQVNYKMDPQKQAYLVTLTSSRHQPEKGHYYRGGIYPAKMYSCQELSGACNGKSDGYVTIVLHIRHKNETIPVGNALTVGESMYYHPKNVPGDDIVGQTSVVKVEVTHIEPGQVGGDAVSAVMELEAKKRKPREESSPSSPTTATINNTTSTTSSNTNNKAYNDAMASVRQAQAQAAYNEAKNEQLAQDFAQLSTETYTWISGMVAEGKARRAKKYNDARDGIEERIARENLYERAEKGNINALKRIGDAYYAGAAKRDGLKYYQDLLDVAISWWEKAGHLGDADAMETLAINSSIFVAKDKARAKEWTTKWVALMEERIATKNNRMAYYKLGQLYRGLGAYDYLKWPEDHAKGERYLAKSVELEYLPALDDAVGYHMKGYFGFAKDTAKAYALRMKTIENSEGLRYWTGSLQRYYNHMAEFHEKGWSVPKDAEKAAYWRTQAKTASYTNVIPNRGPNTTGFQPGIYLETGGKPGESYQFTIEGFYLKYEIKHQKQFAKFISSGSDCWVFDPANQPGVRFLLKLTSPNTVDLWKNGDKIATFTRQEG